MPVAIITDSASNLGQDLLDKYDIDMVSLTYEMDGKSYPCFDPNVTYDEAGKFFYNSLREGKIIKTSLASPSVYYECFKKHLEKGEDIIYISITEKISGSLNSARNAKIMIEDEYPDRKIILIDGFNASYGEGFSAIHAAKLAKEGRPVEEIAQIVSDNRLNIRSELTVDSLLYLKRGGRVRSIVYLIGSLLNIKPILTATKEPNLEVWTKVRGRVKSFRHLVETVKETIIDPENQTLFIAHCDCIDDVEKIKTWLKEEIPTLRDFYVSMYDFCTGAHVGPGTIALFYYGRNRTIDR